jgi:hypothetical protein
MRQFLATFTILLLIAIPVVGQQSSQEDWSAIASLTAGTPVEVQSQDNGKLKGTIASVSDASLVLTLKNQTPKTVTRQSITRVYVVGKRHVALYAAIVGGIGFGTGAAIGSLACGSRGSLCTRGQGVGVAGAIIGTAGALAGAAIGSHKGKKLIYRVHPARGTA